MPKNTSEKDCFYVSVDQHKNDLFVVEYDNGKKKYLRVPYKPSLFFIGKENDPKCTFRSIYGLPMKQKIFNSIYEYKDFLDKVEQSPNTIVSQIGGNISPAIQFISDKYQKIDPDYKKILICYLDIETGPGVGGAFPNVQYADGEILTICLKYSNYNKFIVFGTKDLNHNFDDVVYIKCKDEKELLMAFIELWRKKFPDVITGWFISTFDMPYLFNRINFVLGEEYGKKLSPFNEAYLREDLDPINKNIYEDRKILHICGIQELDYVRLYKKFGARSETESNALNYIAEIELGEKKVEYSGSLFNLYKNDFEKFVEYNVHDVRLVEKLEEKLQLLFLAFSLAYYAKVTFRDVFFQVRMWDSIIYNHLKSKNIVIPYSKRGAVSSKGGYVGAYVKDPQIGMKDWIVSFDVTSLYPHLILQFNISPETFKRSVVEDYYNVDIDTILNKEVPDSILKMIKEENCCLAGNLSLFTNEKIGFLPELIVTLFNERKKYKKISLENKKKYEETKNEDYLFEYKKYDILQNVKKICLNSAYGALGNTYFRFYNVFLAEAVTKSGQLVIKWIERACNEFLNDFFNTVGIDYCVASDTDSVYLDLSNLKGKVSSSDEVDSMIKNKLLFYVDKKLNELKDYLNCTENKIELKREVIADRGVFIAKKRYCLNVLDSEGVKYNPPKLKIMGVEAIKSSTPKICRKLLQEAIRIILQENEERLQEFFKEVNESFKTYDVDDIAFPRSINGLDKYDFSSKSIPIHVYGALVYNKLVKEKNLSLEEIKNGDKIKFFYVKKPNWLNTHVFSYPSNKPFPREFQEILDIVDYNIMIEKAFLEPLKIILEKISWEIIPKSTLIDMFV
ncbi:MAG: DNA polymerase [Patescibacteria group bacterium]|nr:DNA polymerase [Patescibacteria group bacterium]